MDFATALREQIVSRKATRRGKRLLALIDSKPSKRRTRVLARLESHARVAAAEGGVTFGVGAIDWSKIDWGKLFETILTLLLRLLPLFI